MQGNIKRRKESARKTDTHLKKKIGHNLTRGEASKRAVKLSSSNIPKYVMTEKANLGKERFETQPPADNNELIKTNFTRTNKNSQLL